MDNTIPDYLEYANCIFLYEEAVPSVERRMSVVRMVLRTVLRGFLGLAALSSSGRGGGSDAIRGEGASTGSERAGPNGVVKAVLGACG